ncbi:MAG: hypothetical protein ACRDLM_07915 [Gaiellaceae bacterium]
MPSRKQRRRVQKERRHEWETVWVDGEGNELDEAPDDAAEPAPRVKRSDGKPKPQRSQQRGSGRTPLPPSWQRAAKRSVILGVVIFALFYLVNAKNGHHNLGSALVLAVIYTGLFIPFTYAIDRFAYRRWERSHPKKR